jgi:hypothetical protein
MVPLLIEELDANTQYVVLAAAKGEEENVLASVKIATKAFSVPDKKHTLIFYYMGDNTGLETEMEANLRIIQGAAGHLIRLSDKNQVAVFYDNGKRSTLTKLVINEENNRTSHQIIEEYTQSDLSNLAGRAAIRFPYMGIHRPAPLSVKLLNNRLHFADHKALL